MKTAVLAAAIVMMSIGTAAAQAPVRDARPPAVQPTGTGAIAGAVVTMDTAGAPIKMAHVVLIGAATGTLRVTSTDRDGRFQFLDLPADRYQIGASKLPYIGAVAGARRPARPGTPVVLADGQTIGDVTIRLPRGAVITGTITDDLNRPAVGAEVWLQQRRLQDGERVLVRTGSAVMTDDRGQYRLHGIVPGEYVVTAAPRRLPAPRALTNAEVDAALRGTPPAQAPTAPPQTIPYTPVFYPGTTRSSDAAPLLLAAGDERQNVDFRLELATTARLEGIVSGSDGEPVPTALVLLQGPQTLPAVRVMPDGRFSFPNIAPGTYTLLARTPTTPDQQTPQVAFASLDVAGSDIGGLQMTLRPPLSFPGRIAFAGASPPALAGHRIPLRSLTAVNTTGLMPQVPLTNASGAVTFAGLLPGRYVIGGPLFFGASAASVTWALHSVVADGRDVTDLPIDLRPDALPKDVVVTFSDQWQQLSGRISDGSGAPVTDYVIVVFPADKAYWIQNSRRIVTARPATDGGFTAGGPGPVSLPAGDYFVAAVTDLARDEQFDPALLESLIPAAIKTTLGAGERKVQNLIVK